MCDALDATTPNEYGGKTVSMVRRVLLVLAAVVLAACQDGASSGRGASQQPAKDGATTRMVIVRSAITGHERWRAPAPRGCARVTGAGPDYLAIDGTVFDRKTGRLRWHASGFGAATTETGNAGTPGPTADGPTVVLTDARGTRTQARDITSGNLRWQRSGRAVMVGPDFVVIGKVGTSSDTDPVVAVDRRTGRTRWSASLPKIGYASTATERSLLIAEGNVNRLQAFDASTGAARWWAWYPAGGPETLGVADGVAAILGPAGLEVFDDATGARLWTRTGLDLYEVHPGSGVVAAWQTGAPTAQLSELRTGRTLAELATNGGAMVPVSTERFVRVSPSGFEGVDSAGSVRWSTPLPAGIETGSVQVVGGDLVVTIHGTCGTG